MAVAATQLTQGSTGGDPVVTASISPTGNSLILIGCAQYAATIGDMRTVSSVTGNGITYQLVATSADVDDGFGPYRLYLYRGMAASPSSGAVTFDLSASATQFDWTISEYSGVDTTGSEGSGAVVQSASTTTSNTTSITVTLAAFGSVDNATYGTAISYNGRSYTEGSGFTILDESTQIKAEFKATNDTSVDFTWTGGTDDGSAIAVEIKASGVAAPTTFTRTFNPIPLM